MSSKPITFPPVVVVSISAILAALLVWRVIASGLWALHQGSEAAAPPITQAASNPANPDAVWRQLLARNPADADALLMLAVQLEQQGDKKQAREAMQATIKIAPSAEQTLAQAANFFLRDGDEPRALDTMRRLVDLYPAAGDGVWAVFTAALDT